VELTFLPHWVLVRLSNDPRRRVLLNLALTATLLLIFFAVLNAERALPVIPHVCLMQWLLSVPCPGCGIVTSLAALVHLHFREAYRANPAGPVLALHLLLQMAFGTVGAMSSDRQKAMLLVVRSSSYAALTVLLLVWVFRTL
jgi:hypothetical protein